MLPRVYEWAWVCEWVSMSVSVSVTHSHCISKQKPNRQLSNALKYEPVPKKKIGHFGQALNQTHNRFQFVLILIHRIKMPECWSWHFVSLPYSVVHTEIRRAIHPFMTFSASISFSPGLKRLVAVAYSIYPANMANFHFAHISRQFKLAGPSICAQHK